MHERLRSLAVLLLSVVVAGALPTSRGLAASNDGEHAARPTGSPGPAMVAIVDMEVATPTGSFPATLHVPASGAEHPASGLPAIAPGRHPVVVFGHGYLGRVEWYRSTLEHLASWGLIVVAPRSGLELFPDHDAYVEDFSRVLDWLEAEDERPGGWLEGRVLRGAYGASGHSMGGGASIVAAARDARFRSVANLAAAELRVGAIESVARLEAPLLLVAGEVDGFTPVEDHQRPMFEAKEEGPVQLRVIEGGSHCGFLDELPFAALCDRATIDEETQRAISRRLLAGWFLYWLSGREDLSGLVWPSVPEPGVGLETRGPAPNAAATGAAAGAVALGR
jgi:predicted dienelactone hydrolase